MEIPEIKSFLSAYTTRDLQMFNHLVQYFEGHRCPPETMRQVAADVVHDRMMSHRVVRKMTSPRSAGVQPCPSCGAPLSYIKADEVLVSVCKKCRWSAIVEK